jgi:hypothetical protein
MAGAHESSGAISAIEIHKNGAATWMPACINFQTNHRTVSEQGA